jgi:hypothetical protein
METIMTTGYMRPAVGLAMIALAALIGVIVLPTAAGAQVACPGTAADFDGDGFSDQLECQGFDTFGTTPVNFPSCAPDSDRALCVDPNSADLFVILVPVNPSRLPADPLQLVTRPRSEGGLGLAVHQLVAANAGTGTNDRRVTQGSTQKAVRVAESLNATGTILGQATYGTPNGLDRAVVYTVRIANHVAAVYAAAGVVDAALVQSDTERYIRHTIAHEIGHMLGGLTTQYVKNLGGHHYAPGTEVVMEQAVTHQVVNGVVDFNISEAFTAVDQGAVRFK